MHKKIKTFTKNWWLRWLKQSWLTEAGIPHAVYFYCLCTNENQQSVVLFVSVFRLKGDAEYRVDGHRKVLYLDGTESWAETPAVDFRTTSFTLACWVKILPTGANFMTIYGDWSYPYQFRLKFVKGGQKISLQTRNGKAVDLVNPTIAGYETFSAFFFL